MTKLSTEYTIFGVLTMQSPEYVILGSSDSIHEHSSAKTLQNSRIGYFGTTLLYVMWNMNKMPTHE